MRKVFVALALAAGLIGGAVAQAAVPRDAAGTSMAGPGVAVVRTEAGEVQGYVRNGVYTYHGVPYAEAKERFVPAGKVTPWEGVRLAFNYGPISPQVWSGGMGSGWDNPPRSFRQDNNCQNLNVWTPGIGDGGKRPVMVWLHGGGFSTGASAIEEVYDGVNLARRGDVVVVSVNHRLNLVGHLDLSRFGEKYKRSANVGVTDLVDALRWIRDNIAPFGGDPENVTIFGESGGGAKVLALMTTPEAKGLFRRGIVESGATERMGVIFTSREVSERITDHVLEELGMGSGDVESLQTMPYEDLVRASDRALARTAEEMKLPAPLGGGYGLYWEPVVDGDFLPTSPVTKDGFAAAGKDVALLIGSNLTEWTAVDQLRDMERAQFDNQNTWSPEETDRRLEAAYGDKAEDVVKAFLDAYPDKKRADAVHIDSRTIRLPMLKIMSHKADQRGAPVYAYVFTCESPVMNGALTSYHTAEIPFVFHNVDRADTITGNGPDARLLADRMSDAWISFARSGKPAAEGVPDWKPYTRESGATMIFDNEVRLAPHHDRELMRLLAPDYEY